MLLRFGTEADDFASKKVIPTVNPEVPNEISTASIGVYKELLNNLLGEYDTRIRPRQNQSFAVEVNSTFTLNAVVDFDTPGQRIDVMGVFIISWYDELLKWKPQDYQGTKYILIPLKNIWYPKMVFSKINDKSKEIGNKESDSVRITNDGLVTWVPDGIYSSICEVSVANYPFDVQTCELIYSASDETLASVFLNGPDKIPLRAYVENSEWRLLETTAFVKERLVRNFVHLIMKIERRAEFTVYTMIVPLAALALINVFTFLIPIESGEKGALAITLFLAYSFFATITRDALPHNSIEVSYYIVYITVLLVISVLTVIYVIVEAKVYASLGSTLIPLCGSKSNTVHSTQSELESKDESDTRQENQKGQTWVDILKWIDIFMFCFSFVVLTIFSSFFWKSVMMNS